MDEMATLSEEKDDDRDDQDDDEAPDPPGPFSSGGEGVGG
jgi:hypothetical protein